MSRAAPARGVPLPSLEDLVLEDLLALVAGTDAVREVACQVPLRDLADQSPAELRSRGLPPKAARRVAAALELGRRLGQSRLPVGQPLRTASAVFDTYHGRLRHGKVEHFLAIHLDAKGRAAREVLISQGTLSASLVHPREVFRTAIKEAAASLILVHNHPSGDPEPSPEDHEVTHRLVAVGDLVGIRIVDHIVIADGGYVSFLERGLITP